jgi:adenosylmethionine-8-amino-7-oxononanoate aminotransferase
VRNARAIGTITAFDFGGEEASYLSEAGPRLREHFRERGVLLRPLGNTVYVMPPYCISDDDLGCIYDAIAEIAG